MGFEEPVLRVLPLPSGVAPCGNQHLLESVSLWRPSKHRRSPVFDLLAAFAALGMVGPGADALDIRSARDGALAGGGPRDRRVGLPAQLDSVGQRDRRKRFHARWRGFVTFEPYRDRAVLWAVPGCGADLGAGAGAALASPYACFYRDGRHDRPGPKSGRAPAVRLAGNPVGARDCDRARAAPLSSFPPRHHRHHGRPRSRAHGGAGAPDASTCRSFEPARCDAHVGARIVVVSGQFGDARRAKRVWVARRGFFVLGPQLRHSAAGRGHR